MANTVPLVRAITVEPIDRDIRLLTKAVILNNLQDRFLILRHAIHNEAFKEMRMISYKNCLTLARLDTLDACLPPERSLDKVENNVTTITFDELFPLEKSYPSCIVKIDVEVSECLAVQKMEKVIVEIHVPMIVMETDKIAKVDVNCIRTAFKLTL